ncbi:MAG: acyl-CoA dehydratase activase [Chloroflexota bacterium]
MSGSYFLGVDVGSVSTNLVLMSPLGEVRQALYLRTMGEPIRVLQRGLTQLHDWLRQRGEADAAVIRCGATGSGRQLAAAVIGADVVKNEITAHAVAALAVVPDVRTVLEIGGQDSKIIIIRDGVVVDFAMNTVCAAGTGSFLDRQAARLGIDIADFGALALTAVSPVRIAGRCAVFAESDMIHKQQMGHTPADIAWGLCQALVRNYLNNVGKGKEIKPPVVFQGGVAANAGIVKAFAESLGTVPVIPQRHDCMGAIGAALLARETANKTTGTRFRGFAARDIDFTTRGFECDGCANACEVVEIAAAGQVIARWGDRCGRHSVQLAQAVGAP